MPDSVLARKLLIKPGTRLLLLNAPPDYRAKLGTLSEDVQVSEAEDGTFDIVHLLVQVKRT